MKDEADFRRRLEAHFPSPTEWFAVAGQPVTEADLEADAQSFLAFAGAFGVRPPPPTDDSDVAAPVPSSTSA